MAKTEVKPKLTPTQAKVVKARVQATLEDSSISKVAPSVFPNSTPESARVMMHRELQNVTVQQALEIAMAEAGLTVEAITGVVSDAMKATKTVIIRDKGAKGEEADNSAFADEVPDHSIRLKAASMAARWMGADKNEGGGVNINFISTSKKDSDGYGI